MESALKRWFAFAVTIASLFAAPPASAQTVPDPPDGPGIHSSAVMNPWPAPIAAQPDNANAQVPAILHTPIAEVPADEDLTVGVEVQYAHRIADLLFYYRRSGQTAYKVLRFQRIAAVATTNPGAAATDALPTIYGVTIPAAEMVHGAAEYYLASRPAGTLPGSLEYLHFASPAAPHLFHIVGDEEARFRTELLALHLGNRSRLQLQTEYVDFGRRTLSDQSTLRDFFWRLEGDYSYRILGWAYSIRLGAGLLRGNTYLVDDMGQTVAVGNIHPVGLTYGFAELRLRFGGLVRFDIKAILGAGPVHFDGGAGATLLIGYDPGTHFAVGIEGVSSIGFRFFVRLAWNTVRYFPMSFTMEATSWPSSYDVSGRVYYGIEHRFNRYFTLNASIGYAARDFRIGGPSVGLGTVFEF